MRAQDLAHLSSRASAQHVLYWMRTALRGHENPALDVAAAAAAKLGLPLVVAAFVLRSHTHPTARRCQFWLQGMRDTQLELRHQVWGLLCLLAIAEPAHCPFPQVCWLACSCGVTVQCCDGACCEWPRLAGVSSTLAGAHAHAREGWEATLKRDLRHRGWSCWCMWTGTAAPSATAGRR